jgi:hypothetical protein
MSWTRTVVTFWIGAVGAGALVFSGAGLVGSLVGADTLSPWFAIAVLALALAFDMAGFRPLGPHRQVNEDWLVRYRDWVVGFGFGAQLGFGFLTILPTFGYWALILVAGLVGLPVAALIGAAFGIGRSLLLLSTRDITSPSALSARMRQFAGAERRARWLVFASYVGVILVVSFNVA